MERIDVALGERSYPILIGAGLLAKAESFSATHGRQTVVVSNDKVAPLYAATVLESIRQAGGNPTLFTLPDGEQYKTLESFNAIHSFLLEGNYGRDVLLVALGGGVIGDIVGFVAATYQRGVEFIQLPTSLLAQVDSSVGGKTGVNHPLGKNMIGAFHQPKIVIIDINVLSTLPAREFAAGMAEVIKYGIIADSDFFSWIDANIAALRQLEPEQITYAILRCCQLKATIVAKDETEAGERALLNLGHTFGHAIEAEMGYGNWLHGEAVAVGMQMAAVMAYKKQMLEKEDIYRITSLLKKTALPVKAPEIMSYDGFIKHMKRDKKTLNGRLRFVLPTKIGAAIVVADISEEILAEVIQTH